MDLHAKRGTRSARRGLIGALVLVTAVAAAWLAPAARGADESAGSRRVSGTVVDADGKPAGGARVILFKRGPIYPPPALRETRAGDDGALALDGVEPGAAYGVWAVRGNASSRAKRFEGETIELPPGEAAAPPAPLKLTIRPGRAVKATVTTNDGKPIAGARVRLMSCDLGREEFETGADGTVTIEALTPEAWDLRATAPGRASSSKTVNLATAADVAVDFALPPGAAVFGRITGPDGKGVGGVRVNVIPAEAEAQGHVASSNADGAYRVDHVPLGADHRVLFRSAALKDLSETVTLTGPAGRELNVTLEARMTGSVAGVVTDAEDRPVKGATVEYFSYSMNACQTATTDAAGRFRLDDIESTPDRVQEVSVRAAGWAPQVLAIRPGTREKPDQLTVRMTEKGHTIKGRVVDENGQPVNGARVHAGGNLLRNRTGGMLTTGADGRFAFDSLPADTIFDVEAAGFSDADRVKLRLDGDDEVPVVLQASATIAGRVVDADTGKPVTKFNVRVRNAPLTKRHVQVSSQLGEVGEDFSGADGAFRFGDLAAGGELTLAVTAEGYPTQYVDGVETTPGAAGAPVEVKLAREPAGYVRVAGRVSLPDGKPAAGVDVRLLVFAPDLNREHRRNDDPGLARFNWEMLKAGQLHYQSYVRSVEQTTTAADGSFTFAPVPAADGIDLAYWGEGLPQTRVPDVQGLPAAELERLELRFAKPGSVAGRINREAYPVLPQLELSAANDPTFELRVRIKDKQDRYEVTGLPPGAYTLRVIGEPIPAGNDNSFVLPRLAEVEVRVAEGEAATLDLGFGPMFTIAGQVTADGKPTPSAGVTLCRDDKFLNAIRVTRADAEGRYRFTHVPPGRYVVVTRAADKPVSYDDVLRGRDVTGRQSVEVVDADVTLDVTGAEAEGL